MSMKNARKLGVKILSLDELLSSLEKSQTPDLFAVEAEKSQTPDLFAVEAEKDQEFGDLPLFGDW